MVSFFVGFVLGGMTGVLLTAVLIAGRDERND